MNAAKCESIQVRLFDDDCRPNLPLPDDVAVHLQQCESCRQQWQTDNALRDQLRLNPPAKVYRRAYIAAVEMNDMAKPQWENWRAGITAFLLSLALTLAVNLLPLPPAYQWLSLAVFPLTFAVILLNSWYRDWRID